MDRRLLPANGRVAAAHLKGQVSAERYTSGVIRSVTAPVVDLLTAPHGKRERQLLLGDRITLYEKREGWAFVQSAKDGYVGYLGVHQIDDREAATHWVTAPATHVYPEDNFKIHERACLSFGSKLRVIGETDRFFETEEGFVPRPHLAPIEFHFRDPVSVAALFLGTPYLWGGNSRAGIDCSGLVQMACLACNIVCPADSDQQSTAAGRALGDDQPLQRGDLVFWKGHVALVIDETQILHANAFHMAVAVENLNDAIARINAAGDGPVTARRRLLPG